MHFGHVDVETLARTLWGEARGEGFPGMVAVAHVIRNRAADSRWPDTIAKVCTQPWQFSCWNANDPNITKLQGVGIGDRSFQLATTAAWAALSGAMPDPTGGANHYHATWLMAPRWADPEKVTATIGKHVFYKL